MSTALLCPRPNRRDITRCFRLTSDCRTSGLSREQRGLGRLKLVQG